MDQSSQSQSQSQSIAVMKVELAKTPEREPRFSLCLCIPNIDHRRHYEEFTMGETPLLALLTLLILTSIGWLVTIFSDKSELSWTSIVTKLSATTPIMSGFLYCYTVWIFKSKRVVSPSKALTDFNQFSIKNIRYFGNGLILLNAIVFCVTALLTQSKFNFTVSSSIVEYRNACSLVILPVLFPIHSFPISVMVLPLWFASTAFSTSGPPINAVIQLSLCFALILYCINLGNKKRAFLQLDLDSARQEMDCIKSQTTDMHHMIGSMAHDLKTPLQAFNFELENVAHECQKLAMNTPQDLLEFKKNMANSFVQLQNISSFMAMAINRSLDYTKVSTGVDLVPSLARVDVVETFSWIISSLTHKVRDTVAIVVEPLPVEMCPFVLTDKQWFIENVFCFLSNAQKFTSEGHITLRCVLPASVDKKGGEKEGEIPSLIVEVEDTGIGLTDTQKRNLFQPFKQAQSRAGGTGLGLFSLLKRVECLGGECGVKDRPNKQSGSIFWFSFPYCPDTSLMIDMEVVSLSESTSTPNTCNLSGESDVVQSTANFRRILVVDDSVLIQKATKRSLEREGYLVDVASNGYEALKLINSQKFRYDLILLDLNMPIMDGLETITRLRSQEFQSRFDSNVDMGKAANLVIGFSANSDTATKAQALEAGMDAFLSKPLSAQDLRTLGSYMTKENV